MTRMRLFVCFQCFFVLGVLSIAGCPGLLAPPLVLSTNPVDGAINVSLNAVISVTFDRSAIPDSLDGTIVPDITYALAWSQDNTVLTVAQRSAACKYSI